MYVHTHTHTHTHTQDDNRSESATAMSQRTNSAVCKSECARLTTFAPASTPGKGRSDEISPTTVDLPQFFRSFVNGSTCAGAEEGVLRIPLRAGGGAQGESSHTPVFKRARW